MIPLNPRLRLRIRRRDMEADFEAERLLLVRHIGGEDGEGRGWGGKRQTG